ncbi:putative Capsule polysaccharide biosynthesis protein [Seiridium cardinale]
MVNSWSRGLFHSRLRLVLISIPSAFILFYLFQSATWAKDNLFTQYGPTEKIPLPPDLLVPGLKDCPPLRPGNSKVIWAFWMQGWDEIPTFSQYNVLQWTKLHDMDEWEIRILSDSHPESSCHISNWDLDLPSTYFQITGGLVPVYPMIRADLVRSAVIARYGGFWLDTSVTLVKPIESFCGELFLAENDRRAKSICGFHTLTDGWQNLPIGERLFMFENWAFGGRKNDTFMAAWHSTFRTFWEGRLHAGGIYWYPPYLGLPFRLRDMYLTQHTAFTKVVHLDDGMLDYYQKFGKANPGPRQLWQICREDDNRATHRLVDESPPGDDLVAAVKPFPLIKLPNMLARKIAAYSDHQLVYGSIMDRIRRGIWK